ncbi:MAG: DUF4124 domain-containing protein [Myxococcota bacterium]
MRFLAWVTCCVLAFPDWAGAQGVIYRWVDAKGVVHFTDDIGQVPEPYASMYQARIREIEEARAAAVGDRKTPPPQKRESRNYPTIPDVTAPIEARRSYWKERVKTWRSKLADATSELARVDKQLSELRLNPLLRTTPKVKEQIAAAEKRREAALGKVGAAKKMLLETIPKEAKKEQVPPRWIL